MESFATKVVNFFESHCCPGSTCLVTAGDDDTLPPDSEKRNLVNQMTLASSYTKSKEDGKHKSFTSPEYTPVEGDVKEEIPLENQASPESVKDSKSQDGGGNAQDSGTTDNRDAPSKLCTM